MFRNLTLYRFPEWVNVVDDTEFDHFRLPTLGALELEASGWVSPLGGEADPLVLHHDTSMLLSLGMLHKVLPAAVVQAELQERIRAFCAEHGRIPGGKKRRAMREGVLDALLPRAFVKPSRVLVYIDTRDGWLAVDTTSRKIAETVVGELRVTFGAFPARPLPSLYETPPSARLSDWMRRQRAPEGVALDDTCELVDPSCGGGVISARHEDLSSDEIVELLKAGRMVTRLGLVLHERLSFVLNHELVVRRLQPLDVPDDDESYEDAKTELLARFALAAADIRQVTTFLAETFGVHRPKAE